MEHTQLERKGHTEEEMEQIEYLENENLSIQKELVKVLENKRNVLGDHEKENFEFVTKFNQKANEKSTMRS